MALSWKSFDFFDVTQVKPGDDETRAFFESNEIASVCAGSGNLFFASFDGYVRIVGPAWKIVRSFRAHDVGSITHMRQVEGTSCLVTVAEDLSGEPVLKVWALDKPVKKTGMPTCLSTLAISNGRRQFPISAFTATKDLSQLAVGFANGAVTVVRGDLIHDRGTKQRIVYESEEPVTGVELRVDDKLTNLFVSTTSRILKLVLSGKGQGHPPKTVEDLGCAVGCMTVDKRTGDIVVARQDAIYFYTMDGRGPPRAYEAPKELISIYQDYIALVSPPASATASDGADMMRRRFGSATAEVIFNTSTFSLLETDLRIIAHTAAVLSKVTSVFQMWGDLFTLTHDGKVFRYHEKPLSQRLEMLYQRNLFVLAIELAQKSGIEPKDQRLIYQKFGDYLYQKGDYDGAMAQYIKAIDSTEPSQVIRKFLDTQRIHNLIEYLEELHKDNKATSDHTTLLLNCYAKLKDVANLEKFIKAPGELKFDLDTAITMCRQGGYYEQAAYLAQKHGETELVVDILIEDSKRYDDALDYIWHLPPEAVHPCTMKYAGVLIEHCPKEATRLFIEYYTGKYRQRIQRPQNPAENGAPEAGGGSGSGFAAGAANAVQNLTSLIPLPYMNASGADTPASAAKPTTDNAETAVPAVAPAQLYSPPKPRTAFASFIDHPDEFIEFLEACLQETSLSEPDKKDLYTTLFEMYLRKASEKKGITHREEWEAKAKALIEDHEGRSLDSSDIESSNVLLLSHLSNFSEGTTRVKEKSGLYFDIFRAYTGARDTRGALRALRKYGPEAPQLYPAALSYLTSDTRVLDEAGPDELAAVLARIDKGGLLAPLQVVQTLANNDVATVGMVRPYLKDTVERERRDMQTNRRRAAAFRAETDLRRQELADLGAKPAVFQNTRCAACGLPLDLPAVHFLCKHSFHQRCLANSGAAAAGAGGGDSATASAAAIEAGAGECPVCAKDNATIRALRKAQKENAGRHELFHDELDRSEDRFGTIADWFGRGVMGASAAGGE